MVAASLAWVRLSDTLISDHGCDDCGSQDATWTHVRSGRQLCDAGMAQLSRLTRELDDAIERREGLYEDFAAGTPRRQLFSPIDDLDNSIERLRREISDLEDD